MNHFVYSINPAQIHLPHLANLQRQIKYFLSGIRVINCLVKFQKDHCKYNFSEKKTMNYEQQLRHLNDIANTLYF